MSSLAIRRVVLYKPGVGYFERAVEVENDQVLTLSFKQREVNDVLKSLTVLDHDGGTISAVSYDSTTPAEQLLFDTPAPHEITQNYWRFRLTLPAKSSTMFVVRSRAT